MAMVPRKQTKREKPDKQTQGESPPKQKPRIDSPDDGKVKKEPVESLTQTLKFEFETGNDDEQFSLLYVSEAEEPRTFLFISNHAFARAIKMNPSITLEGFDDKVVTVNTVIDLTQVPPATAGLYGGVGDAKPSIAGMLAAAYEINQAILQNRVKDSATAVLVHCRSGFERSVSSTLFYLMGYQEYPFEKAARLLFDALKSGRNEERVTNHNPAKGNHHHQTIQSLFDGVETVNQGKKVRGAIEKANSLVAKETTSEKSIAVTTIKSPAPTEELTVLIADLKSVMSTSSSGARRSGRIRTQNMLTVAAEVDREQNYKQQDVDKKNEAEEIVKTTPSSSSSDSVAVRPSGS